MKVSLRSPLMLPRVAIVDPDLLAGLPPARARGQRPRRAVAADRAVPVHPRQRRSPTRSRARASPRSARSLRRGACAGADRRRSAPISPSPASSAACASRTPAWARCTASRRRWAGCSARRTAPSAPRCCRPCWRVNLAALRARAPDHPALPRFRELAVIAHRPADARDRGRDRLGRRTLTARREDPGASPDIRPRRADPGLVTKARDASSMKGNPVELDESELAEIVSAPL